MQVLAKFKKILYMEFRATLNFRKFKVALNSGSARVFGYSVFRGVLNRVYGILQLKYGYPVYHFL